MKDSFIGLSMRLRYIPFLFRYLLNNSKKGVLLRFPVAIEAGCNFSGNGTITVGGNSYISRHSDLIANGGTISIGSNFFCNKGFTCSSRDIITVGNNVRIGEYVSIYDHNHDYKSDNFAYNYKVAPVVLGNDVWIGRGAVILRGVSIGDGAVISANSVVAKSIPPHSIFINNSSKTYRG